MMTLAKKIFFHKVNLFWNRKHELSFLITIASINFHGFPPYLSPSALLELMFFISGVSLIYINVNNC